MECYLEVSKKCSDFKSFKNEIESFLRKFNYKFSIIIPPHINETDELPPCYRIPCYVKKRKNSFAVFVDMYVEGVEPLDALLILTEDLYQAQIISEKLSLYLMN